MSHQPPKSELQRSEIIGSADTIVSSTPGAEASATTTASESLEGQRVGSRYELLRLLGAGGMGAVYLARDYELDELIAVKLLHESVASAPDARDLLRQEVRLARRVTHPNVARIFELGEHDGRRFVTMEYIEGEALAELMRRQAPLPLPRAVDILIDVCRGLQAAHDAGIIHRDVKPDNVLVSHRGRVVISDFGIARAVRGGHLSLAGSGAGTPAYMAPEQLLGEAVTTRVDVYSLGVMAFEMLTGALPWKHLGHPRTVLTAPPPDPRAVAPELPDAVATAIAQALMPRPDARIASPSLFAHTLQGAMAIGTARTPARTPRDLIMAERQDASTCKRVVAVLPIANRGAPGDDFLADGFTEDLIDCMSAISELRVLSRGATARFAGDAREPHEIGREIEACIVIQGSLQRTGESVQVKVRVIDAEDSVQLWARRYQVAQSELLTLSDQVATGIAASVESTHEPQAPSPRQAAMPCASSMEMYLRAREAYRSLAPIGPILSLYEDAHRLAPDSPLINAGHAMALLRKWMMSGDSDESIVDRARHAAQRAITVAPHLGEPHMALGLLHLHLGEPIVAVRELRTTIALAPSMTEAHTFLGELLAEMGRVPEALLRLDAASRLDPTAWHPNNVRRRTAALLKDWDRAYELSEHPSAMHTPFGCLMNIRIGAYRGDRDMLLRAAERLAAIPEDPYGFRSWIEGLVTVYLGRKAAAEAYPLLHPTGRIGRMSRRRLCNQLQFRAEMAGFAGDHDVVLDDMETAVGHGLMDLLWMDHCPFFEPVRQEARFLALREQVAERAHAAYDALWS